jgi:Ca-activated chloride channel family protein
MTTGDLYALLGLAPQADAEEVKAAYRLAARRFHPDANANPGATEVFRLVANAYAVLSDPSQRAAYDSAHPAGNRQPLFAVRPVYSRQPLPVLAEPQVIYVLLEIHPIIVADAPPPPVNLCLVIDRSTSMQGERLNQVRAAVSRLIDGLRDADTFSVVAFSDRGEVIVPAQSVEADRTKPKARVSTLMAHGGTEILQGLMCGLTELHRHLSPTAVNHLLLLTDGRTYGDEDDCLMLSSLAATDGIVISGLGLGDEWHDRFLDELTGRTGGTAAYIRTSEQVAEFINDHVRGLGANFADRLTARLTLDTGVELLNVFKVSPEASPVPVEAPLRLGGLPRQEVGRVLLKFRLPAMPAGTQYIARVALEADVISLGRRGERVTLDLAVPVAQNAPAGSPPPALLDALSKLSQYQMQERAWQQAAEGDIDGAVDRLKALGTRLLASGQPDLARLALTEATRIERTRVWSEDSKKQLKYGTRRLISGTSETTVIR